MKMNELLEYFRSQRWKYLFPVISDCSTKIKLSSLFKCRSICFSKEIRVSTKNRKLNHEQLGWILIEK